MPVLVARGGRRFSPVVGLSGFVDSYGRQAGLDYRAFNELMALRRRGGSPSKGSVAKAKSRARATSGRRRFAVNSWARGASAPHVVSSVEALRNRGLLDVDYNHALFPALNALSGLVHGTGYVALSSNSGFAYVNVPTAAARDYVAQTLQKLGLTQRLPRRAGAAGAVENAERADKAASEAAKTPSPSAKIPAAKNSAAPKHYSVEEVTRADGSKSWQFKIFDAVLARALVAMGVPASAREKRSSRRAAVLPHVADLASSYGENEAALEHVRTNLAGLLAGGRIVRGPGSKRLLRFQLPLVFVKSVSPRVRSRVRRFHEPLRLLLQESFGVPFNLTVGNASASRGEGRKRLAPVFEVSARNFDEFKRRFPQYARLARGAE